MNNMEDDDRHCPHCNKKYSDISDIRSHMKSHPGTGNYDRESRKSIKAKNGFHGMVYHPTYFLAGEAGRERVNITPIKKHKNRNHEMNYNDYDLGKFLKGYDF